MTFCDAMCCHGAVYKMLKIVLAAHVEMEEKQRVAVFSLDAVPIYSKAYSQKRKKPSSKRERVFVFEKRTS